MSAAEAVLSSAPEAVVAEPIESPVEETAVESPETNEESTEVAEAAPEPQGDGRTLPSDLKALLGELKAKNPKLEKVVRGLFFADGAWKKEFPGGLKEAQALKQQIEQTGGAEAIESLQTELKQFKELDGKWERGDVSYVDDIASANPESFVKMMPRALDRFATSSPESYSHIMGQVIHATMRDANIPTQIYLAEQMLAVGNVDEAKRIIGDIKGFVGSMEQLAKNAPAAPKEDPKAKELASREQAVKDSEAKAFNQGIAKEFNAHKSDKIAAELKSHLNGKAISEFARNTIESKVMDEISSVLDKDPGFKAKFERLYNAGNRTDILNFAKSRAESLIPQAVKKVYRELYSEGTLGTKKPAPKPNGAPAKAVEQGWVKLSAPPNPSEIDHAKTSFDMKYHSKAVLKNGKKVQWD